MNRIWITCLIFGVGVANAAELQGGPSIGTRKPDAKSALSSEELSKTLNVIPDGTFISPHKQQTPEERFGPQVVFSSVYGSIVNNQGDPLCAMVLANGVYMFSCAPVGTYSLSVPVDSNGQITLFGFADGHFPSKAVLGGAGGGYNIVLTYAGGGGAPPPPPPPPTTTNITFTITDACNDGFEIDYKFYDETNNLVWPSATTHYFTQFYNTPYSSTLTCSVGANVCYGGRTGNSYWGVDEDNSKSCSNCCIACSPGNALPVRLTC